MRLLSALGALVLAAVPAAAGDSQTYQELMRLSVTRDAASPAAEAAPDPVHASVVSAQQLLNMRRRTLEELYRDLKPGPIPDGKSDGIASREPGTPFGRVSQAVLGAFWEGKVFDRAGGTLINRLRTGESVTAKVFYGPSWLDGKPAIIIDYKETSSVAGFIRDEIREAAPGIYFGFAYERQPDGSAHANIVFALDFNAPKAKPAS